MCYPEIHTLIAYRKAVFLKSPKVFANFKDNIPTSPTIHNRFPPAGGKYFQEIKAVVPKFYSIKESQMKLQDN